MSEVVGELEEEEVVEGFCATGRGSVVETVTVVEIVTVVGAADGVVSVGLVDGEIAVVLIAELVFDGVAFKALVEASAKRAMSLPISSDAIAY